MRYKVRIELEIQQSPGCFQPLFEVREYLQQTCALDGVKVATEMIESRPLLTLVRSSEGVI